jgi:hypothetical protein
MTTAVSYHIRGILTRYRKVIPIVIAFAAITVYFVPIDSIIAQNGRGPPGTPGGPPEKNPYAQPGRGPPPEEGPPGRGPPPEVPPERGQSQFGGQGQSGELELGQGQSGGQGQGQGQSGR